MRHVAHVPFFAIAALVALTGFLGLSQALAGPKPAPGLRYQAEYADALLEARARNVPLLVSRHKDE